MAARYLIRLDDACPTMVHETWEEIEQVLDGYGIHPIVGVIPENRDPELMLSRPDEAFWERVREWQRKGWCIALHGLHHLYHEFDASTRALVPFQPRSEFVGLPVSEQRRRLAAAYAIFAKEGVHPKVFMAPSHTFDEGTLQALLLETDIRTISDGIALAPFRRGEFVWIPQQLWKYYPMFGGVWTICLHPNTMSSKDVAAWQDGLAAFAKRVVSPEAALERVLPYSHADALFSFGYWSLRGLRRFLKAPFQMRRY
jgi:predicted deacetylase